MFQDVVEALQNKDSKLCITFHLLSRILERLHRVSMKPSRRRKANFPFNIGWVNCVQLSSQGNLENADNYAFFGLGARIISPTIQGAPAQRPMQDGSIQVLTPATKPKKRDADGVFHPLKYRNLNVTLTIDNATVVVNPSNTAGFVVSVPSASPVTISSGRAYTIGTGMSDFHIVTLIFS
jgi:hypothetical protein